jgi:23S rRNA (adenine-N6)-dimethyltransferase
MKAKDVERERRVVAWSDQRPAFLTGLGETIVGDASGHSGPSIASATCGSRLRPLRCAAWVRSRWSSVRERRSRTPRDARRRAYAQNFLASSALAAQLVRDAGIGTDDVVVEVGAGTGKLTAALARRARSVTAIELDPVFATRLRRRFAAVPNVIVVQGDLRRVELPRERFRVLGNVPFNLTTALLTRLLDPRLPLVRADLVLQWEVARKRAGRPRSALSAAWAPWWRFRLGRRLGPESFRPRPAVAAGVLVAVRREQPLLAPDAFVEYGRFTKALYDGTLLGELDAARLAALFDSYAGSAQTTSRPT